MRQWLYPADACPEDGVTRGSSMQQQQQQQQKRHKNSKLHTAATLGMGWVMPGVAAAASSASEPVKAPR